MPEFEWDENKRLSNLEKHQLDFLRARQLFDGRPCVTRESERFGELRIVVTGYQVNALYSVVCTKRGERIRIISYRRAQDGEERAYRELYGG